MQRELSLPACMPRCCTRLLHVHTKVMKAIQDLALIHLPYACWTTCHIFKASANQIIGLFEAGADNNVAACMAGKVVASQLHCLFDGRVVDL